jgi:hypothetical protein
MVTILAAVVLILFGVLGLVDVVGVDVVSWVAIGVAALLVILSAEVRALTRRNP